MRYKYCQHCEKVTPYHELCAGCGKPHKRSEVQKVPDVMGFRPHFNRSIGKHVTSEAQMHKAAEQVGLEKYGYPIKMRK